MTTYVLNHYKISKFHTHWFSVLYTGLRRLPYHKLSRIEDCVKIALTVLYYKVFTVSTYYDTINQTKNKEY